MTMQHSDIEHRFIYHPPATGAQVEAHELVRGWCKALAHTLNDHLPEGREKSLAITHLEDTMMWANAAIARNGNSTE
jgi:hypothetical protein